jgi:hypothetical protein
MKGLAGWQVENLFRAPPFWSLINHSLAGPFGQVIEIEKASLDLQCEASLVFVEPQLARQEEIWRGLGYRKPLQNRLRFWPGMTQQKSMPAGAVFLFKELDRIVSCGQFSCISAQRCGDLLSELLLSCSALIG